jgi:heat shock protein HtpX
MAWTKRVLLFVAVNILIVLTISIVLNLLGVRPNLTARGINLGALAVFCLIWGMGGAFISLALSRVIAKWMTGAKVVTVDHPDPAIRELVNTVHNLARAANLPAMPEVGIYESPELNAFATGPTKRRALVAVSTGLLRRMGRREVEGVLGHEITHIANGDMVTMTLLQGVINAFVMFLARVLAFVFSQALRRDDERGGGFFMQYIFVFVLEIIFSILGAMVVAAFSRWREFRADAGGARLAGRESMIGALEGLLRSSQLPAEGQPSLAAFKISSGKRRGFLALIATHPPLEERIARLRAS